MKAIYIVVLAGVLVAGALALWLLGEDESLESESGSAKHRIETTQPDSSANKTAHAPPQESPDSATVTPKNSNTITSPVAHAKQRPALPTTVLVGVLVDPFGDPLPSMQVYATQVGARYNRSKVTTDGEGRFFCGGLMPGRYDLTIRTVLTRSGANGFIEVGGPGGRAVGPFRRAGASGPQVRTARFVLAQFHNIEAGAEEVRLVVAPESALWFRVVAMGTGEPVAGAVADVDWGDDGIGSVVAIGGRFAVICRDQFRFGVRVRVETGNLVSSPRQVHEVARGENGREILVTLTRGRAASGRIRWKGLEPRPRIDATARDAASKAPIRSTTVRDDGSYLFEGLPEGRMIEIVFSGKHVATVATRVQVGMPLPVIDLKRGGRVLVVVEARPERRLTAFLRHAESGQVHFERRRLRPIVPTPSRSRRLSARWCVEPGAWIVCVADEYGNVLARGRCRAHVGEATRVNIAVAPESR